MTFSKRGVALRRRLLDPLVLRIGVGRAAFADLEHVGRVTGTVRHTPLRAVRVGESIVVGINFGRESDWLKNVRAADRCRVRLGSESLELGRPNIVAIDEALHGTPWWFRTALRQVVRTHECAVFPVLGLPRAEQSISP